MSDDRTGVRTRRARVLVVGGGDAMRDLATLARRRAGHVIEVPTLFDAVDECRRATPAEPIAGVIISADCEHFDAAAVADAFERVDPVAPLIVAVHPAQDDITAECTGEGFEDSIRLPVREDELARVLDELGFADATHPPAVPIQPIPQPKNVVEETVERARERERRGTAPATPAPQSQAQPQSQSQPQSATAAPETRRTRTNTPFQMPISAPSIASLPSNSPGDIDLVRAVHDGHDVQGTAMRVLRFNLGSSDVHFVADPRPGEEAATDRERERRGLRQIPVTRSDGRPFGILLSRAIDETILTSWAHWLATWLEFAESHLELRRLAWTDELTGAGNRRAFEKLLADTIASAQRDWRFFGLMLFDIDDFKRYNDDFGHDTGDEVLKEIVELLRACIRRGDHIFRIGGDEFAVLFCDPDGPRRGGTLDRDAATAIAQRFQRAVNELSLTHIGLDGPGTVAVSTGFASFPWHGLDSASLYKAADRFCLESKRAGKNRITFGPGMLDGGPPPAT